MRLYFMTKAQFISIPIPVILICTIFFTGIISAQQNWMNQFLRCSISELEPNVNEPVTITIEAIAPIDCPNAKIWIDTMKTNKVQFENNEQAWRGSLLKGQVIKKTFTIRLLEKKFYDLTAVFLYSPNEKMMNENLHFEVNGAFVEDDRVIAIKANVERLKDIIANKNLSDEDKKRWAEAKVEDEDFPSSHKNSFKYPGDTLILNEKQKVKVKEMRRENDDLLKTLKKEYDSLKTFIKYGKVKLGSSLFKTNEDVHPNENVEIRVLKNQRSVRIFGYIAPDKQPIPMSSWFVERFPEINIPQTPYELQNYQPPSGN